MRLRNFFVMKSVLDGGIHPQYSARTAESIDEQPEGHCRAFIACCETQSWEAATKAYSNIRIRAPAVG